MICSVSAMSTLMERGIGTRVEEAGAHTTNDGVSCKEKMRFEHMVYKLAS